MTNMVIVFNGDTLDLMKRLEQYSGRDQKSTLDFMLQNFKIMDEEDNAAITRQCRYYQANHKRLSHLTFVN